MKAFAYVTILCLASASTFASEGNKKKRSTTTFEINDNRLEPIGSNDLNRDDGLNVIPQTKEQEEDMGVIDSILGQGTQSRILDSVSNWVTDKAKANPGCVERFVCESYRTGENMNGFPYFLMTVTNAAVSFMVAEMFDQSIDINEITRAARYGRQIGTCHTMKCDFMDGQLRSVGEYLGSFEEFLSSIFNSISNSISIG